MRRPSRKKLAIGDIVRVIWVDIEAKSGWIERDAFERWAKAGFEDRITYGAVQFSLPQALVLASSKSPGDTDAHVAEGSKFPWCIIRRIDVLEETENGTA